MRVMSRSLQVIIVLIFLRVCECYELTEIDLWGPGGVPFKHKNAKEQVGQTSPRMSRRISQVHVPKLVKYNDEETRLKGKYADKNLSVVVVPGGAYQFISTVNEGVEVCEYLNSIGISAFTLVYRHHPYKHPVPLLDALRAIRLVRKLDTEKKGSSDPGSVGVMGFSAGGHLAASVLTFADRDPSTYLSVSGAEDSSSEGSGSFAADDLEKKYSCRPDFSVLFYPVISMDPGVTHDLSRRNIAGSQFGAPPTSPLDTLLSLEKSILPAAHKFGRKMSPLVAPVLIIHSGDDQTVPVDNALKFYRSLNSLNHGVNGGSRADDRIDCDVELRLYSFGNHGYGVHGKGGRFGPEWNGQFGVLESWLDSKMAQISSK